MTIELKEDGVMINPSFHDGNLRGVSVSASNALILEISTDNKEQYKILIPNVDSLKANNFRQGNTIFEFIFHPMTYPRNLISELLMHGDKNVDNQALEKEIQRITKKKLLLLELTTSYGCSLLGLFECQIGDIKLERSSGPPKTRDST